MGPSWFWDSHTTTYSGSIWTSRQLLPGAVGERPVCQEQQTPRVEGKKRKWEWENQIRPPDHSGHAGDKLYGKRSVVIGELVYVKRLRGRRVTKCQQILWCPHFGKGLVSPKDFNVFPFTPGMKMHTRHLPWAPLISICKLVRRGWFISLFWHVSPTP